MNYKVLIPTAGTGSRLGGMTKYINKSLIGVGNKPALSRIISLWHIPGGKFNLWISFYMKARDPG